MTRPEGRVLIPPDHLISGRCSTADLYVATISGASRHAIRKRSGANRAITKTSLWMPGGGFVDRSEGRPVLSAGRRPQIHRLNNSTKHPMNEIQPTQDSKEAHKTMPRCSAASSPTPAPPRKRQFPPAEIFFLRRAISLKLLN
jgi:hypothetical protein